MKRIFFWQNGTVKFFRLDISVDEAGIIWPEGKLLVMSETYEVLLYRES